MRLADTLPMLEMFSISNHKWSPEEILDFIERAKKLDYFEIEGNFDDTTTLDATSIEKLCAIVGRRERDERRLHINIDFSKEYNFIGSKFVGNYFN